MRRMIPLFIPAAWIVLGSTAWSAGAKGGASQRPGPDTSLVHLGPPDGGTSAFVASPPGQGAAPGVVVVQEWWGLNAQIRDVARRLARQGYVAIVPDLYHGKVTDDPEKAHELLRGLEPKQAVADLDSAVSWLSAQSRTSKGKIGVVGFCMGGSYSLELALENPEIAAAVMFYGTPETDPEKLASLKAPLQGHFGADDEGITSERVAGFKTALEKAGRVAEIYVYPGAGHAFMHEGRASYRPDAARQAWARTLAFLQKNLKSDAREGAVK